MDMANDRDDFLPEVRNSAWWASDTRQVMNGKAVEVIMQKQGKKHLLPLSLFLWLSSNLLLSPMIYAATGQVIARTTAGAIGLLLLVTIAMAIYLLIVILQPERF